jgi:Hemerythrin HHE cation binding domain
LEVVAMSSLVFPTHARDQVLEQHVELRAFLHRVIAHGAPERSEASELDAVRLRTAALELGQRFRAHLVFEAEVLKPVFAVLDAWGPERIRDLENEHARQRKDLDALLERFESGEDLERLAGALRSLAVDLLQDMEEEEQGCLRASLLSAVSLRIERR